MFYDEIVEEVRKNRQEHAKKFNYDLHQIAKDLNNKQRNYKRKTISFPPKPSRSAQTDQTHNNKPQTGIGSH